MIRAVFATALAALLGLIGISQARSALAPQRLQVTEKEFTLSLSRHTLHPGSVVIELVNFGSDDHDLLLQRVGEKKKVRFSLLHPGSISARSLILAKGQYLLWCAVTDHKKMGMHATLLVR